MIKIPDWLRLKIAIQTMKDYWKVTLILTLFVVILAFMYAGMFPSMKDSIPELISTFKDNPMMAMFDVESMGSYVGFLNVEFYDVFWVLIFAIIIGFVAASQISKEVESKTIDILMSNPVSRKQIVFEKFIGLMPMTFIINLGGVISIWASSILINEEVNLWYIFLTHMASVFYFIAIISLGILVSVIINEKMKASIFMIAIVFASYFFDMVGKMVGNEGIRVFSLKYYFDSLPILQSGEVNVLDILILFVISIQVLIIAMVYFEHRDINVS